MALYICGIVSLVAVSSACFGLALGATLDAYKSKDPTFTAAGLFIVCGLCLFGALALLGSLL